MARPLRRHPFEDRGGTWQALYYQHNAIENTLEAIANGRKHILLTLATATGKTFIEFQLTWKLFQSRWNLSGEPTRRPRILFLADRNILADVCDEVTFWHSAEQARNPDSEILPAARPALATLGGPLIVVSKWPTSPCRAAGSQPGSSVQPSLRPRSHAADAASDSETTKG